MFTSETSQAPTPDYAAGLRWFVATFLVGAVLVALVVTPLDPEDPVSFPIVLSSWPLAAAPLIGLLRAWWEPGRAPVAAVGLSRGDRILNGGAGAMLIGVSTLIAAPVARQSWVLALVAAATSAACFQVVMACQWKERSQSGEAAAKRRDLQRTPGVVEAGTLLGVVVLVAGVAEGETAAATEFVALVVAWTLFTAYVSVAIARVSRLLTPR